MMHRPPLSAASQRIPSLEHTLADLPFFRTFWVHFIARFQLWRRYAVCRLCQRTTVATTITTTAAIDRAQYFFDQ